MTTPAINDILGHQFSLRRLLRNTAFHNLKDASIPDTELTPEKEPDIRAHIANIASAIIADPSLILTDTYTPAELADDWMALRKWAPLDKAGEMRRISANTRVGHKFLDHYMTHFYDVGNYAGRTLRSLITDAHRALLEKALMLNVRSHSTPYRSEIRRAIVMTIGGNSTVTKYKAATTKSIVAYYNAKRVLDPCIGWGGRMLGALAAGAEYVGCDPDPSTAASLRAILADPAIPADVAARARIYESPCEDVLGTEIAALPQFDLVLTSPPYFNLELYTGGEQSTTRFPTWEAWVTDWLTPVIRASLACLREGGVSAWSVKNIKTDRAYNLKDKVIAIHAAEGWKLVKTVQIDGPCRMGVNRIGTDGKPTRKSQEETFCFMRSGEEAVPAPVAAPDLSKKSCGELRTLCRDRGIKGFSKFKKAELLAALAEADNAAVSTIQHV